ncbi:unnamed protein product [Chrysodeixis includens]|uniref:Regucalcin n=1 Tax=Chrysodeixis includens TaxID=689277 RepID=A0A9P0FQQ9_CHRIL|nr:unnamed protein product [Chrysodeixis includens]
MAPVVTQVVDPVSLGEGPHWHSEDNALYFISMNECGIDKFEPDTGKHVMAKLGRKVVEIEWAGDEKPPKFLRVVAEVDHENPKYILNDGKADPLGRLFVGTVGDDARPGTTKRGSLFRIDPDGTVSKLATGIQCSNGLCFDLKEKAFYYVDSFATTITRYDYDVATGNISNPTIAFSLEEQGLHGCPDGMTIDTDGNLWVAVFWGSCVLKIDPRKKKVLEKIDIPVPQVTSVTWGGPNLDILYVVTGCINFADRGMPDPPSGATYAVTGLNARGHPNLKVRLDY